jgi:type I restriction enzyme S subunit
MILEANKEFYQDKRLGLVPVGWNVKRISEVFHINQKSLTAKTKPDFTFNYITIEAVSTEHIEFSLVEKHQFKTSPGRARRVLCKGDVLISTVRPNLKSFVRFKLDGENWICSTGFNVLTAKEHQISDFYFYQLLSFISEKQFASLVAGTNYPAINDRDFDNIRLYEAPPAEQRAIASILSKVDEAITATKISIAKAELLKKSLMQNLLTGKLKPDGTWRKEDEFYKDEKFGNVPIGWHWGRLSEIAEVIAGQSPAGEYYNEDGKGVPMLNGPTEFTDFHPIPVQYTTKTTKLCEVGDILFTVRGSSTGRMNIADQQYCIGRGIAAIRDKEESDIYFIYYTLITIAEKILAEARGSGTTFPNVNRGELLKKWVLIPKDEQAEISKKIKSIDVILNSKETKIKKLERLKKALMQNLLTGKVRVKVPKEELQLETK